jgi:hypothetical protein
MPRWPTALVRPLARRNEGETLTMSTKLLRSSPARLLNSLVLRFAGTRFFPLYGVIEHRGRRSGRIFHTPVVVRPLADGFVVPMPWGERTRLVPQRARRRRLCHPLEGTLPPGRPARGGRHPRCNGCLQQLRAIYHVPLRHHPVPPPAPPDVAHLIARSSRSLIGPSIIATGHALGRAITGVAPMAPSRGWEMIQGPARRWIFR